MSLLFPLYLAGLTAIALPIVFHLIRRTPHGRTPFSALMFLAPSPPRFVRRKRLDQVLLLCLRVLALLLLALAFARPYLRTEARVDADAAGAPRIALLLDTSASMRRPGLWEVARSEALAVLDAAPADALLAFYTFDTRLSEHVGFETARGLGRDQAEVLIRERLAGAEPTWFATDLGAVLVDLAGRVSDFARQPTGEASSGATLSSGAPVVTIVVVSDLQEGAGLAALDTYDWPQTCLLDVRPARASGGNAGLHLVPPRAGGSVSAADEDAVQVRITNSSDALVEEFRIGWLGAVQGSASAQDVPAFCPAGESRVIRAPARPAGAERLVLTGDGSPFDNTLFDRVPTAHPLEVVSLGGAEGGEGGLDYYLRHLFTSDALSFRTVSIGDGDADVGLDLDLARHPLVVAKLGTSTPLADPAQLGRLLDHVERGGVLLAVLTGARDTTPALRALLGDAQLEVSEADAPRDFTLLGEIDFTHPLFAPFADPRYNDFTKMRFWKRRRIDPTTEIETTQGTELRVLARFEDGAPFLVERALGAGRVLVATSSWLPVDSDLARSTKFVPLMRGMLRLGPELDPSAGTYLVGDPVPIGPRSEGVQAQVVRPDREEFLVPADAAWFTGTDLPGHYELENAGRTFAFTVHLDPDESRTDPYDASRLGHSNVAVAREDGAEPGPGSRQELVHEIEQRQKLWRWLILGALGALLFETFWAGRLAGRSAQPVE